jgi:hypothetical protein
MLKRSIAIFLLTLASTVWLAHTIFPHHHHKSQACLVAEHCQHDYDHRHHSAETDSHEHPNNTTSTCTLDQLAIVPQPIFKGINGIPKTHHSDTDYSFFQAIVAYTHSIVYLSPKPHSSYINRVSTRLYLVFIGQSLGLRAPPAV